MLVQRVWLVSLSIRQCSPTLKGCTALKLLNLDLCTKVSANLKVHDHAPGRAPHLEGAADALEDLVQQRRGLGRLAAGGRAR